MEHWTSCSVWPNCGCALLQENEKKKLERKEQDALLRELNKPREDLECEDLKVTSVFLLEIALAKIDRLLTDLILVDFTLHEPF